MLNSHTLRISVSVLGMMPAVGFGSDIYNGPDVAGSAIPAASDGGFSIADLDDAYLSCMSELGTDVLAQLQPDVKPAFQCAKSVDPKRNNPFAPYDNLDCVTDAAGQGQKFRVSTNGQVYWDVVPRFGHGYSSLTVEFLAGSSASDLDGLKLRVPVPYLTFGVREIADFDELGRKVNARTVVENVKLNPPQATATPERPIEGIRVPFENAETKKVTPVTFNSTKFSACVLTRLQ